ncbi:response regulator [Cohnella sp. CFH 77786]|uniref:response regulator n=1 Tax=Cohnella sp. CFH 77786 TaxID=2662265 RepID=UPI001C609018|nr:response regulator [Cohnella sp. CFH 77786]MBW5448298.1 response regulator [Cohnella sp. CFH 77786]
MKVIVVDDEPLALESMVRMLKRLGAEIAAACQNPLDALVPELGQGVDAAFVDIDMPGMNGLELAARLQTRDPGLAVVFVTAYDQYAVKAFDIAAADYLVKPVRAGRLEITLERLRQHRPVPQAVKTEPMPVLCLMHDLGTADGKGKFADIPWRTSKAKELFAYLVHTRDLAVSKEHLQDLLWSDLDIDKAMANLHTTVYQIRQSLKAAELPVQIVYAGGRYRVELSEIGLDIELWEAEIDRASAFGDEGQLYRLLLDGYRGDYLQAEGYLWSENERERLRIKWLQLASDQAARLERVGLTGDAIRLYQSIQERFPVWEACYLALMRSYDKIGNTMEVKNQYAKLKRTLEEELGMQPERGIAEWYDRWSAMRASV